MTATSEDPGPDAGRPADLARLLRAARDRALLTQVHMVEGRPDDALTALREALGSFRELQVAFQEARTLQALEALRQRSTEPP